MKRKDTDASSFSWHDFLAANGSSSTLMRQMCVDCMVNLLGNRAWMLTVVGVTSVMGRAL